MKFILTKRDYPSLAAEAIAKAKAGEEVVIDSQDLLEEIFCRLQESGEEADFIRKDSTRIAGEVSYGVQEIEAAIDHHICVW